MAKPNYHFQKHQRELAKKKKKEEKLLRKSAKNADQNGEAATPTPIAKETDNK